MTPRIVKDFGSILLLATARTVAVMLPMAIGILNAPMTMMSTITVPTASRQAEGHI